MNKLIYIDDYDYIKVVAKVYQRAHVAYKNARGCDISESARQEIFKFRQKQRRLLFELILRYGAQPSKAIEIIDSFLDDELCDYPARVANAVIESLGLEFVEKQVTDAGKDDDENQSDESN